MGVEFFPFLQVKPLLLTEIQSEAGSQLGAHWGWQQPMPPRSQLPSTHMHVEGQGPQSGKDTICKPRGFSGVCCVGVESLAVKCELPGTVGRQVRMPFSLNCPRLPLCSAATLSQTVPE